MRKIVPHNRTDLIAGGWKFLQATTQEEIRDRIKDAILAAGIVPTVDATADELDAGLPNLTFTVIKNGTTQIDVGLGEAYNADGERIAIPSDDAVIFNEDAPLFTTTGITARTIGAVAPFITPFSTGHLEIPDPDPTNAKSEAADAGTDKYTRYVFIAYESVVRTVSLAVVSPESPDHQNDATGTFAVPSPNRRKPIRSMDRKTGQTYIYQFVNGYRIYVARRSEVIFENGPDGTPILGNLTNHPANEGIDPVNVELINSLKNPFLGVANSIYLGKYVWDENLSQIDGDPVVDNTGNENPRKIVSFRPFEVATVGNNTSLPKVITSVYGVSQKVRLQHHVATLGTGTVTFENPHGLEVANLTAGFATPDNIIYQTESFGDGITDIVGGSAWPDTTALTGTVFNTDFNIPGFLAFARPQNVGSDRTINITGTSKARLTLQQLGSDQKVYVAGIRLDVIGPSLDDAASGSGVDAFVPFFDADVEGDYAIFVMPDLDTAGRGIIGKVLVPAGTAIESLLAVDRWPIAVVYWNKSVIGSDPVRLQRTQYDDAEATVDLRTQGLLKKDNISTEAFRDPNEGAMALLVHENMVANSEFALATTEGESSVVALPPAGWEAISGSGTIAVEIVASIPADNDATGPRTATGLKVTLTSPSSPVHASKVRSFAPQIKPNTVYSLAFWAKLVTPVSNDFSIIVDLENRSDISLSATGARKITLDRASTIYQRVAIALKTNALPDITQIDPASATLSTLVLHFQNLDVNVAPPASGVLQIANVSLVEGDWVTGPVAPSVHAGEIFMWDKTTSCPPGSTEVTAMQGRLPVGANGSLAVGDVAGAAQLSADFFVHGNLDSGVLSGSITGVTDQDNAAHSHTISTAILEDTDSSGSGTVGFDTWSAYTEINNATHAHTITGVSITGTVATPTSTELPAQALLFCRRL